MTQALPETHDDVAALLGMNPVELMNIRQTIHQEYYERVDRSGRKVRRLRVPSPRLRALQRKLLRGLEPLMPASGSSMAVSGRGAISHAQAHVGFAQCATFDVKNCFPSVRHTLVARALLRSGIGTAAALCVRDLTTTDGQLPQGAPTSSWLLDVVMVEPDVLLSDLASQFGGKYTRYVDDLAISGPRLGSELESHVRRIIGSIGFSLHPGKSRLYSAPRPALITGIEVTDSLRPRVEFVRDLRSAIRAKRLGFEVISAHELQGRLGWVRQVSPNLWRLLQRGGRGDRRRHSSRGWQT